MGMFKISFMTMREQKAKKSRNLVQYRNVKKKKKQTVGISDILIPHVQAVTCCLGSR